MIVVMRWGVCRKGRLAVWDAEFGGKVINGTISAMMDVDAKVSHAAKVMKDEEKSNKDDESDETN
jgi:hypothetical protein